jgi:DNA repair exonuclease SbcCD ATPase subunit
MLEAAEQSAAALRAEAAEEIDAQLERAQGVAARLSERADHIERSLQALADSVREELSALKADLEELRAVGEGVGEGREAGAPAERPPAAADRATA